MRRSPSSSPMTARAIRVPSLHFDLGALSYGICLAAWDRGLGTVVNDPGDHAFGNRARGGRDSGRSGDHDLHRPGLSGGERQHPSLDREPDRELCVSWASRVESAPPQGFDKCRPLAHLPRRFGGANDGPASHNGIGAEAPAITTGPGALSSLRVVDLTRVLGSPLLHHDPERPRRRGHQARTAAGR